MSTQRVQQAPLSASPSRLTQRVVGRSVQARVCVCMCVHYKVSSSPQATFIGDVKVPGGRGLRGALCCV